MTESHTRERRYAFNARIFTRFCSLVYRATEHPSTERAPDDAIRPVKSNGDGAERLQ
jgi:hypothetical protein